MNVIEGKKVLVFTAHPDDEVACGGTIAKLTRNNNDVVVVIATNGDKGTHDPSVLPEEISKTRKREMDRAAQILGLDKVIWLGFDDGSLETNRDLLKESVYRTIREEKPHAVITFDPWKRWDPHPDHRTIGFVAVEAAYLSNGCWYYPEHLEDGLQPHDVDEIYLFHSDDPNYSVDIKDTFDVKLKAANAHESQRLQFPTFGEKYLYGLKNQGVSEEDWYKEKFRKVNDSDLTF